MVDPIAADGGSKDSQIPVTVEFTWAFPLFVEHSAELTHKSKAVED
jgi:hypothetical protein